MNVKSDRRDDHLTRRVGCTERVGGGIVQSELRLVTRQSSPPLVTCACDYFARLLGVRAATASGGAPRDPVAVLGSWLGTAITGALLVGAELVGHVSVLACGL